MLYSGNIICIVFMAKVRERELSNSIKVSASMSLGRDKGFRVGKLLLGTPVSIALLGLYLHM